MDAQLETIGARCHVCSRQDFLPFSCPHCTHTFCLSHSSELNHGCTASSKATNTSSSSTTGVARIESGPSLKQLQDEHLSRRTSPDPRTVQKARQVPSRAATDALERLKSMTAGFMIRGKSSTLVQSTAVLARLKREAKGDSGMPVPRRLYLFVSRAVPPRTPMSYFVDREWRVGRVLDAIARDLGMVNENARTRDESKRLHLLYDGLVLEPSQQVGTLVKEAGEILIFRGTRPT